MDRGERRGVTVRPPFFAHELTLLTTHRAPSPPPPCDTPLQVKDVLRIVAVFAYQCDEFHVNVLAAEFGRCTCGRAKRHHNASAFKRKAGLGYAIVAQYSPSGCVEQL